MPEIVEFFARYMMTRRTYSMQISLPGRKALELSIWPCHHIREKSDIAEAHEPWRVIPAGTPAGDSFAELIPQEFQKIDDTQFK